MIEQELPHSKIEIPNHWKFPERNNPGLKVEQIDLDQRFLAFNLPYEIGKQYRDYFFDPEGEPLDKRTNDLLDGIYISLVKGDIKVSYWYPVNIGLQIVFLKHGITVPPAFELGADDEYRNYRDNQFGEVNYVSKELSSVVLGKSFIGIQAEEDYLRSPMLIIRPEKLRYYVGDKIFFNYPYRDESPVVFVDEEEKPIFRVEWEIQKFGQEGEKDGVSLFSVSQTHIETGIVKILRAPLILDSEKASEAIFSRPPYPKDEKGRLVAPWRNIDRIVGASLSYSYPPQSSQK